MTLKLFLKKYLDKSVSKSGVTLVFEELVNDS